MSTTDESHSHRHNTILREESPTITEALQEQYRVAFSKRFEKLRGVIRETLVDNRALDVSSPGRLQQVEDEPDIPELDDIDSFDFTQSAAKQVAFRRQLQEWIEEGVLQPVSREEVEEGQHYTGLYVSAASIEGVKFADNLLDEAGVDVPDVDPGSVIGRPIHADALRVLYTRNYDALKDITEDMDRQISGIMSQAVMEGWGNRRAADRITREIRDIQHKRARTLARTEMLNAHNTTTLDRYREFGVTQVEILTHTPCPICIAIEREDPYPIDEVPLAGAPFHPNCVCSYAPVV